MLLLCDPSDDIDRSALTLLEHLQPIMPAAYACLALWRDNGTRSAAALMSGAIPKLGQQSVNTLYQALDEAAQAVSSFLVSMIDDGEHCYAWPAEWLESLELDPQQSYRMRVYAFLCRAPLVEPPNLLLGVNLPRNPYRSLPSSLLSLITT